MFRPHDPLTIQIGSRLATVARRYFLQDPSPRIIVSKTSDPFFNKSVEDYLFDQARGGGPLMFLWQNDRTVFIGRNQNPWKECNLQWMDDNQVHLVRRFSGGGAVYQDMGNLCWSFFEPQDQHNAKKNLEMICRAIPLRADVSGRNDITVDNRKVSGSAFKFSRRFCLHHGTLLVDVNLDNMLKCLNVNKEKLLSKGVTSVKSRVLNMKEMDETISVESLSNAMKQVFQDKHGDSQEIEITPDTFPKEWNTERFEKVHKQMEDWEWRYGQTPQFDHNIEHRFDWGIMDLHVSSKHGIINDVKLYSDSLYPDMIDYITGHLKGAQYSPQGVQTALQQSKNETEDPVIKELIEEYASWLPSAL